MATADFAASTWQKIFRFKGLYNCFTSIALILLDDPLRAWLSAAPTDPVYRTMFLALAFSFGLGYMTVGRDLTKNHEVIRMGIIGQLSVFAVTTWAVFFVIDRLPVLYFVPALVDLTFAILFLIFLWKYPATAWTKW